MISGGLWLVRVTTVFYYMMLAGGARDIIVLCRRGEARQGKQAVGKRIVWF